MVMYTHQMSSNRAILSVNNSSRRQHSDELEALLSGKYSRNGTYMLLRIARNKLCSLLSYSDQYRDSPFLDSSLERNPLHDGYSRNISIPRYFPSNDGRNIGFRY